ncbi:MAG: 3-coathanger stack domain-containing protein [Pseudomonadota bacterium]
MKNKKYCSGIVVLTILLITAGISAFASDLTVTGTLSNGTYYTDGKITSANECRVESESNVFLLAPTGVVLNPGFRVQAGGRLNVIIGGQNDLPAGLDADNDGMPDTWEIQNNLDSTQNDASQDADNDGASNLVEFKSNTNPNDGNSRPKGTYFEYDSDGRLKRIELVTNEE